MQFSELKTASRRLGHHLKRVVGRHFGGILSHALFLAGLAGVSFGAGMIYKPAGVILAGVFAVWVSFLISAERKG